MKAALSLLSLSAFGALVNSHPVHRFERRDIAAATKAIETASPGTASCDGAQFADECATALQAAPYIIQAFADYAISDPNEWAAVLSLMLFESGGLKFNRNHFPEPGRPGQGTRNMQMIAANTKYVEYLASKGKLDKADVEAAGSDPDKVLDLVLPDEFSFASAAWYYSTQCTDEIKKGVQSGTQQGYEAYLTSCVETTAAPERITGWQAAKAVCS